jgi:amino acid adenylation domain-containing protein
MRRLNHLLESKARRVPGAPAVIEADGVSISYAALDAYADLIAARLAELGVVNGDRVGLCVTKTIPAVAAIFGILKCNASYVPTDVSAPVIRSGMIYNDCGVRAVVVDAGAASALAAQLDGVWIVEPFPDADGFAAGFEILVRKSVAPVHEAPEDLAYILYTSGSTGRPKGVRHTHASAFAFIDWCSGEFEPQVSDRFSSHAPFHFDLSILDLYVPLKHGAAVVLITSEQGKQPGVLAKIIADRGITVWYSTPSILRMLVEHGQLAERDCSALRIAIFAGEVFPAKHLRALAGVWSWPVFYNLYGPTETNVCTYYRCAAAEAGEVERPLPIGRICSDDRGLVVTAEGAIAGPAEEGELVIAGGSVMLGYWNLPERNAEAFLPIGGERYYRTGDVVRLDEAGAYVYLGRRDRMVKRRGYRVELGEIEAALQRHPAVSEAAVLAQTGEEGETQILAFCAFSDGSKLSTIKMKQFCAQHIPAYMQPDRFVQLETLPKTSTDKTDYQRLKELA